MFPECFGGSSIQNELAPPKIAGEPGRALEEAVGAWPVHEELFSIIVSLSKAFERMFSFSSQFFGLAYGGRWNASCGRCRGV